MSALIVTADTALGEVLLTRNHRGWSELIRTLSRKEARELAGQLDAACNELDDAPLLIPGFERSNA